MKVIALSLWVFINITVLGLFTYVYILWSHYWKVSATPKHHVPPFNPNNTSWRWLPSHSGGFPQLPQSQWRGMYLNSNLPARFFWNTSLERKELPQDKLKAKVETYKNQLIVQLRQSQLDSNNVLYNKEKNKYGVNYSGMRTSSNKKPDQLVCAFKAEVTVKFLDRSMEPFRGLGLGHYFPAQQPLSLAENLRATYNTCAIVSSAGSLFKSNLGRDIDSHDAVLRFNSAPTEGFEDDVGGKTTFRIVNSQVVSKPRFDFLHSSLYNNVTLMAWDPSNYTVNLNEWYKNPEFNVFEPYFKRRTLLPAQKFYIFHPQVIWDTWNFIQKNTGVAVLRNPPSSGFLGIAFLLNVCNWVDVYEYIPSMRLTKRCHYFDVLDDIGCTFGSWHPLASEKLISLAMHSGSDIDIFQSGFIRIRGLSNVRCP